MRNISKEMSRISDGRKVSKMKYKFLIPFVVAAMAVLLSPPSASAAAILGTELASFAVLGASTVTNVPTSAIVGNVGVWSSGGANAITGFNFSPGVAVSDSQVTGGQVHAGTDPARLAQRQLTTARNNFNSLGSGTTLVSPDLAGLTLSPGVYTVTAGTTNLSGTLTLDGGRDANAFWLFQMDSSLITSPNSVVKMINTDPGAGLYWNVRSSATIDTNTTFLGNILALTSIAMNSTATDLCGRALANTGAVTLQQNKISGDCLGTGLEFKRVLDVGIVVVDTTTTQGGGPGGGTVVSGGGPAPIPEPGTMMLLGSGLIGLVGWGRKKLRK